MKFERPLDEQISLVDSNTTMSKSDSRKRQRATSGDSDSDSAYDEHGSRKTFADGYDENYRGDANDRAWLETLSEREREAELLKRHEQREIIKRREEINKRLKSKVEEAAAQSEEEGEIDEPDDDGDDQERNQSGSRNQSALFDQNIYDDDEDEEDYRSSTNRRKMINESKQKSSEHSKSLQVLAERRRKRQDELNRKSTNKVDDDSSSDDETFGESSNGKNKKDEIWKVTDVYKTSSSESGSDDDDSDQDSSRRRRLRSRSPEGSASNQEQEWKRKKATAISQKEQLKSMILSRFRMEKWCHAPFFSEVVRGAFVRINIGVNNGQAVYRICEVEKVVETGKVYTLGSTRTNKGLQLRHGNNQKIFRLEYVSNNEISDGEFQRWKEAMIKQSIPLPSLENLEEKSKEIDKYKNYTFKNEDITKIVEEKKRFRKAPINYAMTKNEILKEIEIAKDKNDAERVDELKKKLVEMEERASALDRKRSENISIIAQINQRNRQNTQKNVEMALLRNAQEQKDSTSDPFTRHRCAPSLVTKPNKDELIRNLQEERRSAAEAKKAAQKNPSETENSDSKSKSMIEIPVERKIVEKSFSSMTTHERGSFSSFSEKNDDLFASHDFELDPTLKLFQD